MSLIQLLKFRLWKTGYFKMPHFEMPHLQMAVFQIVVIVASGLLRFYRKGTNTEWNSEPLKILKKIIVQKLDLRLQKR